MELELRAGTRAKRLEHAPISLGGAPVGGRDALDLVAVLACPHAVEAPDEPGRVDVAGGDPQRAARAESAPTKAIRGPWGSRSLMRSDRRSRPPRTSSRSGRSRRPACPPSSSCACCDRASARGEMLGRRTGDLPGGDLDGRAGERDCERELLRLSHLANGRLDEEVCAVSRAHLARSVSWSMAGLDGHMIATPGKPCSFTPRLNETPSQSCRPSASPVRFVAGRIASSFEEGEMETGSIAERDGRRAAGAREESLRSEEAACGAAARSR